VILLRLFLLGFRSPGYRSRWKERLGFLPPLNINSPVLWVHAVSVGEVEAATPVVENLLLENPQHQLIVTTVTPTGAETVKRRFADKVTHLYLPYDLPFAVLRFIKQLRPSISVVMETEIWPNLYYYCHRENIPVVLVNARMSLRSLNGYQKFAGLMKKTLGCVTQVIAQSRQDAERFVLAGCDENKVSVAGNLKFDVSNSSRQSEKTMTAGSDLFANRPVWIAASTHDKEEALVLDAYEQVLKQHKDCLLILAPRHPHRFNKVAELCANRKFKLVRKSGKANCTDDIQIFLLDTLGELKSYYACADLAYVGGSLVPAGGHNLIEPASLGVPVISGIHISNFHEVANLLEQAEAAYLVENITELAQKVTLLLGNKNLRCRMGENGKNLIAANQGSAEYISGTLQMILR
jgi:3-deoxy-D-manno-octulosonic-acid transferase